MDFNSLALCLYISRPAVCGFKLGRYILVTKLKLIAIYNIPIIVKHKVQDGNLVINYKIVADLIYPEQHFYIEVSWVYIEGTYNYYIVYKSSKPDLFILVNFVASSRSLQNKLFVFNSSHIKKVQAARVYLQTYQILQAEKSFLYIIEVSSG